MKIRNGFVSNSSSSSFILFKQYLNKEQIDHLKNYETYALSDEYKAKVESYVGEDKPMHQKDILKSWLENSDLLTEEGIESTKQRIENTPDYSMDDYDYYPEGWAVEETSDVIDVSTWMNNFDMIFFCKMIGIDIEKCGLMIEDEHCFTIGHNDAKTDLKNYANDDNYWENYDKYWYSSKYYTEKIYPINKEMFDKGSLSHVVEPGGNKEWVRDGEGNVKEVSVKW